MELTLVLKTPRMQLWHIIMEDHVTQSNVCLHEVFFIWNLSIKYQTALHVICSEISGFGWCEADVFWHVQYVSMMQTGRGMIGNQVRVDM